MKPSVLLAAPILVSIGAFPGVVQPDPGAGFSTSRRGLVAAFAASFRDAGDRYDPAATPTVFLWDIPSGSLRQLTASGPSDQPSVENASFAVRVGAAMEKTRFSRTLVAFRSTANLAGKNGDGSAEIFVWDSQTGGFTQITDAIAGASSDPVIGARFHAVRDAAGKFTGQTVVRYRVAFLSTSDLAGDNAAGIPQVFVYDSGLPEVGRTVQISHSAGGAAGPPAIDGAGDHVGFVHDGALLPGDGTPEVYAWDRFRGLRRAAGEAGTGAGAREPWFDSTGRFLSWTADAPAAGTIRLADLRRRRLATFAPTAGAHRAPSLATGAGRIVCLSTDPGDGGAPVAERPVELRRDGRIREIGLPGGGYGAVRIARDRRFLLLTSTGDLDGTNAAGREVLFTVRYRP